MDYFHYKNGALYCEGVRAETIAEAVGTPAYVYSKRTFLEHFLKIREAFSQIPSMVCYSVKANPCQGVLKELAKAGAGFDIVSGGELYRAMKAGCPADRIVYAGVGKTSSEIAMALAVGIHSFNSESAEEVANIERIASALGTRARICLRINPDVDAHTHRHITTGKEENKFGLDPATALALARKMREYRHVELAGLHMHIGSQITEISPYVKALGKVLEFKSACDAAYGRRTGLLDIGGGFGIFYKDRAAKSSDRFASAMMPLLKSSGCKVLIEPGRFIIGNAGILLTRVIYTKRTRTGKNFLICDAGMNDLIRPVLYEAYHKILPARCPKGRSGEPSEKMFAGSPMIKADVVGPICESGDFLALGRRMPKAESDDLLAVFSAGAYGYSMSSTYNSRPRSAEVLVDGRRFEVVTLRESYEDLVRMET